MRKRTWLTVTIWLLVVLLALFLGNEWRVERRWQQYVAEAHARGGKLLLTDFTRPEIPDPENFAAIPMLKAAFAPGTFSDPFRLPDPPKTGTKPPVFGDPVKGTKIDWEAWRRYFQAVGFLKETSAEPARDVLHALDHFSPLFQEWEQGQTRPECRFPLDLSKGAEMPLPHLGVFQNVTKLLALRARAHFALGDSAAAEKDLETALRGYHYLEKEPTLISGLVRISMLAIIVGAVGDGLKDHAWTDADLKRIEADLSSIRLGSDYELAMGSELGFLNTTMESLLAKSPLERGRYISHMLDASDALMAGLLPNDFSDPWWRPYALALIPRSVYRLNQLRGNRYLEELLAKTDAASNRFNPDRETPSAWHPEEVDIARYYYLTFDQSSRMYAVIEQKYIVMQIRLDQARQACALERCRLTRGVYPTALSELTPEFIATVPVDIYAHAPYHYRRVGEKSFLLYGVGEDRRDDGGKIDPKKSEKQQADIIWLYAPAGSL